MANFKKYVFCFCCFSVAFLSAWADDTASTAPVTGLTSASASSSADSTPSATDANFPSVDTDPPVNNLPPPDLSHLSVKARLTRLENIVQNQSQISDQIAQLQQQLQTLRGQIEVLNNANQQLQAQLRTMYEDIDKRVTVLETQKMKAPPVTVQASSEETKAYNMAYQLLSKRDFVKAGAALQAFLKQYPRSPYAANAHYWLGEVYLAQKKNILAYEEFDRVVKQYPKQSKVPDALLKQAFINDEAGKTSLAVTQLKKIQQHYPKTTAAQLAAARLDIIQQR